MLTRVFAILLQLSCLCGCLSSRVMSDMREEAAVRREFVNNSLAGEHRARYLGIQPHDGRRYEIFELDGALAARGEPRVLLVRIPVDPDDGATAAAWESGEVQGGGECARVIIGYHGTVPGDWPGWLKDQPAQLRKVIILSLSDESPSMVYVQPARGAEDVVRELRLDAHIRWVVRSRSANAGRALLVPLAFVADIVTSPFQLVGAIILFNTPAPQPQ